MNAVVFVARYIFIFHHFKNPFARNHSHLQHIEFISYHSQWPEQQVEVHNKRNDYPRVGGIISAPPNQQANGKRQHNFYHRKKNRISKNGFNVGVAVLFVNFLELVKLFVFNSKSLNHTHSAKMLLYKSIERSNGISDFYKRPVHTFFKKISGNNQDRERNKTDKRQPPVGRKHEDQD